MSLFAVLGVLGCSVAQAQIAPGPLSTPHANLGGLLNCTSCHGLLGRGLKCLECHQEIKRRVDAGEGYHSRAYKSSAGDCAQCHMEHSGPKSTLIHLDRISFDHGVQTGFTLEGKHREQKCDICHTATRIAAAARSEIRMKDLNLSLLGLDPRCVACHREPHQEQLGADCLSCHSQVAWRPASGFSHARTEFPLTGLHREVLCKRCHVPAMAASIPEGQDRNESAEAGHYQKSLLFKGLRFSGCQECHNNPHRGAFEDLKLNDGCDSCHNTGGWKNNRPGKYFDHSLTKFRLIGKHANLTCNRCHKEGDFRNPIPNELCGNCHEDPHQGQFASRAGGSDCSACHNPESFKPSLFDRDDHMETSFPLEGKHAALPCVKCHQSGDGAARYKIGKLSCGECHSDPHGGAFVSEPYNNKCSLCHTQAGFEVTTFTIERHRMTPFPLTGIHAEVPCGNCHKPLIINAKISSETSKRTASASPIADADIGTAPDARRRYRFLSPACDGCHIDPHGIKSRTDFPCETCHVPQQLNTPLPFDHSRTGFKLELSHLDTAHPIDCIQCHRNSGQAGGAAAESIPVFSGTSPQCSTCHSEKDAHGGQFGNPRNRQNDCASCHTPQTWSAVIFDHNDSSFILDRAHLKVACTNCHDEVKEMNGTPVRVYRSTPVECLECH